MCLPLSWEKHRTVKTAANMSRKQETAIAPTLLENPKQGLKDRRDIARGRGREERRAVSQVYSGPALVCPWRPGRGDALRQIRNPPQLLVSQPPLLDFQLIHSIKALALVNPHSSKSQFAAIEMTTCARPECRTGNYQYNIVTVEEGKVRLDRVYQTSAPPGPPRVRSPISQSRSHALVKRMMRHSKHTQTLPRCLEPWIFWPLIREPIVDAVNSLNLPFLHKLLYGVPGMLG